MTTDSRIDTYQHILEVQQRLARVAASLQRRLLVHDASKLQSPEVEGFNEFTPRLATLVYGSTEYRSVLGEMKPFIHHHYRANSHHPEHYDKGIQGMSLLDLIEMLCDWSAASLRHTSNLGLVGSIDANQQRFSYSDELKEILLNTVPEIEGASR